MALPIPANTQSSAALFRWRQLSHSGSCCDHWALDDVRIDTLGISGLPVTPTNTANFNNGVWSGSVTVQQPATNATLLADDALGHLGQTLPFDLLGTPKLRITRLDGSVMLSWPAAAADFRLEQTPLMPLPTNWAPVPNAPVIVGDRNTVTNSLTESGVLYRLKGP